MPLLLCDLDNTLVDRAGAFARWASDFAGAHGQDESFASWLVELDAEDHRLRTEMFAAVQARLGLAESVDELIERYYGSTSRAFDLTDASTRRWRLRARPGGGLRSFRMARAPSWRRSDAPVSTDSSTRGVCRKSRASRSQIPGS